MKNTDYNAPGLFLDTNILIDYLLERGADGISAERIFDAAFEGRVRLIVAAHSLTNISYITRKILNHRQITQAIKSICGMCEVCEINADNIQKTIAANYTSDFEDALQIQCAVDSNSDYIITRDMKDFSNSPVAVMHPRDIGLRMSL